MQVPAVVAVHVVDVIIGFQILAGDLLRPVTVAADAVAVQLPAGGGIDRIAQLFPGGGPGGNVKFMGKTCLVYHILKNKLRHGTSANIAMANK